MKYPINPKNKIFQWGPIDGRPLFPDYWGTGFSAFNKAYKPGWPLFLAHIENEKFTCLIDHNNLYNNGEEIFKKFILNQKEFASHYAQWNEMLKRLKLLSRQISLANLDKLNKNEFESLFLIWNNLYGTEFWNIGSLPEMANWGGEQMLSRNLKKYIKDEKNFNSAFEKLSAPENFSFYQKEELGLSAIRLIPEKKIRAVKLRGHQRKYFWLLNSYHHTQVLEISYFQNIIGGLTLAEVDRKYKELKNYRRNILREKNKIIKKFNLPKEILEISSKLSFCIWWQDLRKSYIFQANHIIDIFLKEISKRHKIDFDDLHLYTRKEVETLVSRGTLLSKNMIKARQKNFLAIYHKEHPQYMAGTSVQKIVAPYYKDGKDLKKNISSFKGITTSPGKIRGKVKIISTAREIGNLKKGEILVTPMTSPDYIVGLRKACAIITDHGGMTCHAAIVSRELGIPCIVGTRIATQVLKDGDMAEVDADNGRVTILK